MSLIISSGLYRGRKICAPKGLKVRPSSLKCRQALFNICQHKIENAIFLDLFAGSGAIGIEALSRNAKAAYFVDHDKEAIRCIKKNLIGLDLLSKATVFYLDAFKALEKIKVKFDLIYIDPPYHYYEDSSFLIKLLDSLYSKELMNLDCWVFIEISSDLKIDLSFGSLHLEKVRKYGFTSLLELHLNS